MLDRALVFFISTIVAGATSPISQILLLIFLLLSALALLTAWRCQPACV
jgi:uncharacterized membrane protein YtjA (UPF0391 family)